MRRWRHRGVMNVYSIMYNEGLPAGRVGKSRLAVSSWARRDRAKAGGQPDSRGSKQQVLVSLAACPPCPSSPTLPTPSLPAPPGQPAPRPSHLPPTPPPPAPAPTIWDKVEWNAPHLGVQTPELYNSCLWLLNLCCSCCQCCYRCMMAH